MINQPDNAEEKQARGRFRKGESGNPAGRRKGSRNRATVILDRLADGQAEAVLQATIQAALGGDSRAQKAILDRVWPARRGKPIRLDLPPVRSAGDAAAALEQVIGEVATGAVTPEEAQVVAGLLETRVRWFETIELEARLERLEREQKER
ncbi:DUF5681 domain-containing protein [Geminicoccus flavidas]|uniref:DUF5681 domain-containing protein n=1 Tax=Geminicoccus flavidas TaxID=2506407 RepID=UPI00135B22E7|nr:DUF5681 domain-containing protein [Geminicoccus flavidas]